MTQTDKERLLMQVMPHIRAEAASAARRSNYSTREDLLQEAIIAAWTGLDHFDESRGVKLWTFIQSCIHYRLLSHWSHAHAKRRFPNQQPDHETSHLPDQRIAWRESAFEELIAPCRERDREVMRQLYVLGYTQEEVGRQQGVSHQCIAQIHRRALTTIRAKVKAVAHG